MSFLTSAFSTDKMVMPEHRLGEMPSSKEVYKNVFNIAWPATLEMLLITLISSIDTIMIGKVGVYAIAAVGITSQPRFIFQSFVIALNTGVTALISRRWGERDRRGASSCLSQALFLSICISLILCTLGFVLARPIMTIAGADSLIIEDSVMYFKIIMIGLFFYNLSLTINAAQRGIGNTKVSMRSNVMANIVKLILNLILIGGWLWIPAMGIKGAAIGTLLSNIFAFIVSSITIFGKNSTLKVKMSKLYKLDKKTLGTITDISSSVLAEQLFLRFGFFAASIIVAKLGTLAFSAHQICNNILAFSTAIGDGLAITATSLVGINLGKKRRDLSLLYGKAVQKVAFIISSVLFVIFIFGRYTLVGFYTTDKTVIEISSVIIIFVAFVTHVQTSNMVYSGALRGAGDTKFIAVLSMFAIGIIRPVMSYSLAIALGLGLKGVWITVLFDCTLRVVMTHIRFAKGKWMNRTM